LELLIVLVERASTARVRLDRETRKLADDVRRVSL
jgi:hypothetical protein